MRALHVDCTVHQLTENGFWSEEHRDQTLRDAVCQLDDPEVAYGVYSVAAMAPRSRQKRLHQWRPQERHLNEVCYMVNGKAVKPLLAVVNGGLVRLP